MPYNFADYTDGMLGHALARAVSQRDDYQCWVDMIGITINYEPCPETREEWRRLQETIGWFLDHWQKQVEDTEREIKLRADMQTAADGHKE